MKNIINRALAAEKKLFTLLLAVAASVGTMFASTKIGDLYYNLDATNHTAEVDGNRDVSGEIIIPASVTYNSMTYSVTSIGNYAFYYCSGLTSVTNFANTPQEITSSVFDNVDKSTCVLYVPAGSISAYQSADVWKDFSNILPISQQGLEDVQGNNVQCTKIVHNGQIFIKKNGKLYNAIGVEVK